MAGTEDDDKGLLSAIKKSTNEILGAFAANVKVSDLVSVIDEVDKAASEVINLFGQGQEMVIGLKQSMTQAVESVDRLGGSFNDILKIQSSIADNFGRNLVLSRDSYEGFYASFKVTGVEAGKMVDSFKNVGVSAYDSVAQMQKVVDISRESGVNAGKVSGMVVANLENLNRYNFQGGVEGMAKMAAQAASLRIDMKDINSFASTIFKPEGAIEMAAALQRLGVAQSDLLDPLRLMDLSANDPTELQNQIVKMTSQFTKMNDAGKFEIMPGAKRQFMEIAEAMHIPYETLTKMALGSADLNEKMKQIKFPESAVSDDEKKMIANLAEMKDGKAVVTFNNEKGEQITKEVSELSEPEIAILKQGDVQKSMEQLAKEQLSTQDDMKASLRSIADRGRYAVAGSRTTQAGLDFERKVYQGVEKSIPKGGSVAAMQNQFDTTASGAITSIAQLVKGDFSGSLSTASKTATNAGTALKNLATEGIAKTSTEFKSLKGQLSDTVNLFKRMSDGRLNKEYKDENTLVRPGKDVLKMPGQEIQLLEEDTFAAFTRGSEVLQNLGSSKNNQQSGGDSKMVHTFEQPLVVTVQVNAQGVDTTQLQLAMNSPEISQTMVDGILRALGGHGQVNGKTTSKQINDVRNTLTKRR
jgi:hypothetical protein